MSSLVWRGRLERDSAKAAQSRVKKEDEFRVVSEGVEEKLIGRGGGAVGVWWIGRFNSCISRCCNNSSLSSKYSPEASSSSSAIYGHKVWISHWTISI